MKNTEFVFLCAGALLLSACGETVALQKEYVASRDSCQHYAEVKAEWLQSRGVEMDDRQRNAKLVEMFNECMHTKNWDLGTVVSAEKPESPPPEKPAAAPPQQEKDTTLVNRGVGIGVGPAYALEEQPVEPDAPAAVSRAQAAPVPDTASPAAVAAPAAVPPAAVTAPTVYPPPPNIMPPGVMILPVPVVPYWGGAVPPPPVASQPAATAPVAVPAAAAPVSPVSPPPAQPAVKRGAKPVERKVEPAAAAPIAPVSTRPVSPPAQARPAGTLSPQAEEKIRRILNEAE